MRRALVAAAALGALLAAGTPAAQARRVVAHGQFDALGVAGDAVAWSDAGRPAARVRVKRPGSASRLVFSQRVPRGFVGGSSAFAASPTRMAILVFEQQGENESPDRVNLELRAGPLDGPLTRIARGTSIGGAACQSVPLGAALGGDVLVWIEKTCPSGARILARDLAAGGPDRQLAQMPFLADLDAAGRFAAWRQGPAEPGESPAPGEIVVYDLVAGAEAYRVAADPSRLIERIALQGDGKVLVEGRRAPPGQGSILDWYSVAEPTPHPLSVSSSYTFARLGADRILLSRFANRATDELVLSDLGGTLTTLARFPRRTLDIFTAFDGRTAAYVETGCAQNTLFAQDVSDTSPVPETTVVTCPVRIIGGTLRVRSGRARMKLACVRGCDGSATLTSGGRRIAPTRSIHVVKTGSVSFRLDARARRALARAGSLRATVTVRSEDRNLKARRTTRRVVLDP